MGASCAHLVESLQVNDSSDGGFADESYSQTAVLKSVKTLSMVFTHRAKVRRGRKSQITHSRLLISKHEISQMMAVSSEGGG